MEGRIVRLESDVAYLQSDIRELKAEIRMLRDKLDQVIEDRRYGTAAGSVRRAGAGQVTT
jgi:predicted RNase H-like nuclease (RuvC/YqgF family)